MNSKATLIALATFTLIAQLTHAQFGGRPKFDPTTSKKASLEISQQQKTAAEIAANHRLQKLLERKLAGAQVENKTDLINNLIKNINQSPAVKGAVQKAGNTNLDIAMLIGLGRLNHVGAATDLSVSASQENALPLLELFAIKIPAEIAKLKAITGPNAANANTLLTAIEKVYLLTPDQINSSPEVKVFVAGLGQASTVATDTISAGDFNPLIRDIANLISRADQNQILSIIKERVTQAANDKGLSPTDREKMIEAWISACMKGSKGA